jgi:hypothetical protein
MGFEHLVMAQLLARNMHTDLRSPPSHRSVQVTLDAALSQCLGLSIVQKTIHEHGGEITARNRPQGSAMVTITLPLPEWT